MRSSLPKHNILKSKYTRMLAINYIYTNSTIQQQHLFTLTLNFTHFAELLISNHVRVVVEALPCHHEATHQHQDSTTDDKRILCCLKKLCWKDATANEHLALTHGELVDGQLQHLVVLHFLQVNTWVERHQVLTLDSPLGNDFLHCLASTHGVKPVGGAHAIEDFLVAGGQLASWQQDGLAFCDNLGVQVVVQAKQLVCGEASFLGNALGSVTLS